MGFFKKIGNAIKKNVSFKNLVKVATTAVGFVPGVGGIAQQALVKVTDAVEAKKMAKKAEADGKKAEAEYWNAQTKLLEQNAGQTVGAVAGAGANLFAKSVLEGVNDGLSSGVVQGAGVVGATVVSSTLKVWFQRNWKYVVGGAIGLIGLIWFLRRDRNNNSRGRKR